MHFADCFDPAGTRHGIPTFPWRLAPDGLATRRQLRALDLRPGGQDIAGQVLRLAFGAARSPRSCTESTGPSPSGR